MRLGPRLSPRASSSTSSRASLLTLASLAALASGCEINVVNVDPDAGDEVGDTGEEVGDGDGDANFEPIPVRGAINMPLVVVNQGVDVPIAVDGEWVGPEDRNTYVVSNRDTLLRAFWEIPEEWEPRDILARLELKYPDGTTTVLEDVKEVSGPSYPGDIDRSFFFALLADEFPPGLQFHISLWEAEPGYEDLPESSTVTAAPSGGLQQIGVQPEPAELKIVLVPVRYQTDGCNTNTADITEEEEREFLDYIHEQNPVKEVIWEFRRDAPIEWNSTLNSLAELWEPLQDMRITDAAPPNAYYYALVDACASGIDGAGGIAPGLAPPTKEAAYQRVSSGLWLNGNNYSYHTMVHELGHNQGRAHIFCAGGEAAGVDPSYPYDNGVIGVWGFGIRKIRFHNPTGTFDYMTYCSPNWPSDWTWGKTYNQIRELTSWDYEGAAAEPAPAGEVLIGLLMNNGEEKWWTTRGSREPEYFSGAQTVAFDYGDQVIEQPAATDILEDGSTMVTVQLPRSGAELQGATRIAAGQAHVIDLQPDAVKAWTY